MLNDEDILPVTLEKAEGDVPLWNLVLERIEGIWDVNPVKGLQVCKSFLDEENTPTARKYVQNYLATEVDYKASEPVYKFLSELTEEILKEDEAAQESQRTPFHDQNVLHEDKQGWSDFINTKR